MSKPVNTASRVMRQMTEQERHSRELVDLREGWKNRERELLAHIERLESEQAIACARCGGCGEDHVTVPREPTTAMLKAAFDECSEGSDTTYREAWAAMINATQAQDGGAG